jgi:gliding motility-associated lipoprotein GldD
LIAQQDKKIGNPAFLLNFACSIPSILSLMLSGSIFNKYSLSNSLMLCLFIVLGLSACEDNTAVPKPRAYPRVKYPRKEYVPFKEGYCDFTFDLPKYAQVDHDTLFFNEKAKSDCWFNILVPELNAKIYCSYYPIGNRADFDELVKDAYEMTNKHNIKASYIDELPIHRNADHVHGVVFNVEGPAASSYQFFLSDSTRHFLRGALYFNTQARPDSLAPVVKFMKVDLDRMVSTLKWGK